MICFRMYQIGILKASWGFVYNSWLISANFCETEIAERSRINANCLVFRYFWYFLLYILAARVKQKQDSRYKLSIINRPYIKFIFDALGVSDFDAALDWSLSKMDKCPWSNLIYNILEIYLSWNGLKLKILSLILVGVLCENLVGVFLQNKWPLKT